MAGILKTSRSTCGEQFDWLTAPSEVEGLVESIDNLGWRCEQSSSPLSGVALAKSERVILILCLLIIGYLPGAAGLANATTYYIDDANGSDTNVGDSAHPWKTLTYTMGHVTGGDTVIMRGGNYDSYTPAINWTGYTDWVTLKAAEGETPVVPYLYLEGSIGRNLHLKFDGVTFKPGKTTGSRQNYIYFQNASYLYLLNCTFIGNGYAENAVSSQGVYLYSSVVDCCNITIDTCIFTGDGPDPNRGKWVAIGGSANGIIKNCDFSYYGSAIAMGGRGSLLIQNNHIHNCQDNGIETSGQGVQIINNTIHDIIKPTGWSCHNDGIQVDYDFGTNDLIIRNNIIYNVLHHGLFLNTETGKRWLIENNLIYNTPMPDGAGSLVVTIGQVDGCIFRNNTVASHSSVVIRKNYPGDPTVITSFHNNIVRGISFYEDPCSDSYGNITVLDENDNIYVSKGYKMNSHVWGGHTVQLKDSQFDALFANYDANDFSLAAGSLAINFGNTTYAPTTDILGNSRVGAPDAGCYEYISAQTYTLNITAVNGTVAKSPDKASYNSGETVTIQATPNTGYDFDHWSGDAFGTNSSVTITMNSTKSVTANFAGHTPTTYTLGITAPNGTVTKSPDKSSYSSGETVTLQATPNTGYDFDHWSGDASGTNNPVTITMNSNKSVTANFAVHAPNTYTLTITAPNGTVTKTPDKTSYNSGETVTLQATPNTGYDFANWSGDAFGTNNPVTITMNSPKSVTANFAGHTPTTYTLGITAMNGSVTKTPDKASYNYGETVTIQAVPNTGYTFANWSDNASGSSNPVTITMNTNKSVTANFDAIVDNTAVDNTAPSVTGTSPAPNAIQVPLNSLIILHVTDAGKGVDANSVIIRVNNNIIYSGNTANYTSSYGACHRTDTAADYTFIYQANKMFDFDNTAIISVNATDLAGNAMTEYSYSFKTEMRSFGKNKKVGSDNLNKDSAATVRDSSGNIWVAWQAGQPGSRDIYIAKLAAGAEYFDNSIQLTNDTSDQCNPVIAAGSNGKLYVAWQDNRRGNWDIYVSTSTGGTSWSAARRVTDTNDNHINPAIAVEGHSSNRAYIVWQDNRNGNQDIYIASSTNGFVTQTTTQITSNGSDQAEPAIAVAADNTAYVVWTDTRNGSNDIYGAASNSGPWTNVPIVSKTGSSQSNPAIATEAASSILHFVWVDDTAGNKDIYYATSNGLPGTLLSGISIIYGDSKGTDQLSPTVITTGSTGNNLKVFVCWQDKRNTGTNSADTDLYIAEVSSGNKTNVFVGDDGTNSGQGNPAIGTDGYGQPYLVWTDTRNTNTDIYYAASTFAEPTPMISEDVSPALGATVGTEPSAISKVDDVSVIVPSGAYPCDIKITISRVENQPKLSAKSFSFSYEFGPSGITFNEPVTITIPYDVSNSGNPASAYWYNPMTGSLSQTGIMNVEDIVISSTLHALRFKTTHFTQLGGAGNDDSSGGGGGCSMSPAGQGSIGEFLLPYIVITVAMVILKLRDKQRGKSTIP